MPALLKYVTTKLVPPVDPTGRAGFPLRMSLEGFVVAKVGEFHVTSNYRQQGVLGVANFCESGQYCGKEVAPPAPSFTVPKNQTHPRPWSGPTSDLLLWPKSPNLYFPVWADGNNTCNPMTHACIFPEDGLSVRLSAMAFIGLGGAEPVLDLGPKSALNATVAYTLDGSYPDPLTCLPDTCTGPTQIVPSGTVVHVPACTSADGCALHALSFDYNLGNPAAGIFASTFAVYRNSRVSVLSYSSSNSTSSLSPSPRTAVAEVTITDQ